MRNMIRLLTMKMAHKIALNALPMALLLLTANVVHAQCEVSETGYLQEFRPGHELTLTVTCDESCDVELAGLDQNSITVTPGEGVYPVSPGSPLTVSVAAPSDSVVGSVTNFYFFSQCFTFFSYEYSCMVVGGSQTDSNTVDAADAVDPVSTLTGELFHQYPADLDLGGPMRLRFSRYYASLLLSDGLIAGTLGDNWLHNFEWNLVTLPTLTTIADNRGREINFRKPSSSWVLTGKGDIAFRLTQDADGFTLADPRVNRLYSFDNTGQLVRIADGKGNVHALSYAAGRLSEVSDGLGRTLSFGYNASGQLISVSDGVRVVSFEQTGNDLTRVTDAMGHVTTYAYDPGGRMTSSTRPSGNTPFTQTWNADSQVITQNDAAGNTTTLGYGPLETAINEPTGHTRVHRHSFSGDLVRVQDAEGRIATIESDFRGRRGTITDRMGDTTVVDYDFSSGKPSRMDHADGTSTSMSYFSRFIDGGRMYVLNGVTHRDGTTESWGYDSQLNLTSYTDQAGEMSSATYNGRGQPLTRTNRAGGVTSLVYNVDGTLHSATDPAGNVTTLAYDLSRRPDQVTWDDGATRSFDFDDNDRLISTTDERGGVWAATYDANGRVSSVTSAMGETAAFTYDGNDRLSSVTDALGGTSTSGYDSMGRPEHLTDANGNTTTLVYDAVGRLASVIDPLGHSFDRTYDAEGVIASATDPLGNTTTFDSDVMGRITRETTPLGNVTDFDYDAGGRVTSFTDPAGETTTLSRDARGQLVGVTLPGGVITVSHQRNALGQINVTTDPNGNDWETDYDNQGRLTSRTDPLGRSLSVAYDTRNRPEIITYPGGMGTLTIVRDAVGNVTSRSFSDGTTLTYGYDANNRLTSATGLALTRDANGRIVNSNGIGIVRDARGLITGITLAPGKTVTYGYDAAGRLTQVADWIGGVVEFSFDAAGRVIGTSRPNGVDTTYTHDADGRLIGIAEGAISDIALTRDAKGQITGVNRATPEVGSASGATEFTATYDAASQVSGNTHDSMGRLTASGGDSFVWDLASRLVSYTVAGKTVSATYDALGNRLSRTADGTTRTFVWNAALRLPSISIERENGTDLRYYIHTPGGNLLYSVDATTNARRFDHFDEMGNTMFVTDDAGAVIASYAYTPYGKRTSSTGDLDNPFTWQGAMGVMDEGNAMYYVRARYYDSRSARFLSHDPIKSTHPKKVNPYQYANRNPLRFIDPLGSEPSEIALDRSQVAEFARSVGAPPWVVEALLRGATDGAANGSCGSSPMESDPPPRHVHAVGAAAGTEVPVEPASHREALHKLLTGPPAEPVDTSELYDFINRRAQQSRPWKDGCNVDGGIRNTSLSIEEHWKQPDQKCTSCGGIHGRNGMPQPWTDPPRPNAPGVSPPPLPDLDEWLARHPNGS